jgi:hypothetical protein
MPSAARIAILLAVVTGLLAGAGPASAVSPPTCWNAAVWARPGTARTVELYCPRNEHAEVAAGPESSQLELLRSDGELLQVRLTPTATAPEHETFTLHLSGPAGPADQIVQVTNVPLSRNTPPRCEPVTIAQRTSGAAPVSIEMHVRCQDDEHDDYTLSGSGPGTHLDAPLQVAGGAGSSSDDFWHYLPTIASGEEHTAYHAVDALGARSADAPITVKLGPAVDRLPECRPNPSGGGSPLPINARPGQARRFAIICEDADGDAIVPQLRQASARGDIVRFDVGAPMSGYWGNEVWVDVVYVPRSAFEGEDPFVVGATGPRGAGPAQPMQMVSRALPENLDAGCALWNPTGGGDGEPVTLHAECSDKDGDPLTAAVTTPPAHGRVSAPALTVGRYGATTIGASYVPDAGFVGADVATITVSDSNGWSLELDFPLRVGNGIATFGPMSPENLAFFMAGWRPSEGALKTPVQQARTALNTRSVRLVKRIGDARVYAPSAARKAASKGSVLALTCVSACTVTARATVAGGAARISKLRVAADRATGLALTHAQRGRAKRMRAAGAVFRLTVASKGAKTRRATVRVKLRR